MSWFSKLLGTDKALDTINTIAEGGLDLADKAFYTDQEKAEFRMKKADMWLRMSEMVSKQSAPTAISRRIIAWSVIGMVVFDLLVGTTLLLLDMHFILDKFLALNDTLGIDVAFPMVIGFYFGPHIFAAMGNKK